MAGVIWSPESLSHLAAIRSYVSETDPVAAGRLVERLERAGARLAYFPGRGRPSVDGTRELVTVQPYVMRYRLTGPDVEILLIRHMRQQAEPR